MLAALCDKGLVVDVRLGDTLPLHAGAVRHRHLRVHDDADGAARPGHRQGLETVRRLLSMSGEFYAANFKDGQQVSVARALPHLEHLGRPRGDPRLREGRADRRRRRVPSRCPTARAGTRSTTPAARSARFRSRPAPPSAARRTTSCATAWGARSRRSEMKDVVQRSKELKLVFSVDNVRNQPAFLCHCCGCCCGILEGINKHGYPNAIVSSTLVPHVIMEDCNGCQKCARACHVSAITLVPEPKTGKQQEDVHAARSTRRPASAAASAAWSASRTRSKCTSASST